MVGYSSTPEAAGRRSGAVCLSLAALLLGSLPAAAQDGAPLTYAGFRDLVLAGKASPLVLHFAKCKAPGGKQPPDVVAVADFSAYNITSRFIATSTSHLFEAPDGSMRQEYVRARFFQDDHVEIYTRVLDPATEKPVAPGATLSCRLADGSVTLPGARG